MTPPSAPRTVADSRLVFLGVWLAACALMIWVNSNAIRLDLSPDPDDTLRLLEVRDWLAGQSWFDVTQYRLNPPNGAPMHWSRLVDLPIAAVILLMRPFVGPDSAEMIAKVTVPLLTLGVVMVLVRMLCRRLMNSGAALLAVVATPVSIAAAVQLTPMRIDHHGWQLVAGLVMAVAAIGLDSRRSGIVAGIAAATWLNISAEALPFLSALGAWFGLNWLRDPRQSDRLRFYALSLAGTSLLLFAATRSPGTWFVPACDAVSNAHLAALIVLALCCGVGVRSTVRSWRVRLYILATAGALALAAILLVNGQCLHDPFATLDPLVRKHWYDQVKEGLPIWRQKPAMAASFLAQPLVGLVGGWFGWRAAEKEQRARWETYVFLLIAATSASVLVLREGGLANLLALPGTAYISWAALTRAQALRHALPRIFASVLALGLMLPAYVVPLAFNSDGTNPKNRRAVTQRCLSGPETRELRALPTGNIAAPLDISPAIIVHTDHKAIASGHHRNMAAMRDTIRLFTAAPEEARAILARRKIDYVVVCPTMPELRNYAEDNRDDLAARLLSGRSPAWLEPVTVPGLRALKVWRVGNPSSV